MAHRLDASSSAARWLEHGAHVRGRVARLHRAAARAAVRRASRRRAIATSSHGSLHATRRPTRHSGSNVLRRLDEPTRIAQREASERPSLDDHRHVARDARCRDDRTPHRNRAPSARDAQHARAGRMGARAAAHDASDGRRVRRDGRGPSRRACRTSTTCWAFSSTRCR